MLITSLQKFYAQLLMSEIQATKCSTMLFACVDKFTIYNFTQWGLSLFKIMSMRHSLSAPGKMLINKQYLGWTIYMQIVLQDLYHHVQLVLKK